MTVAQAELDRPMRIVGFGSLHEDQCSRLSSFGLFQGASVTKLLRTPLLDPVECLVGAQLVVLDAWVLEHIVVDEEARSHV